MGQEKTYVAKTLAGLEPLLVDELQKLGMKSVSPLNRGAEFSGTHRDMMKANMASRFAIRILEPFWEGRAANPDQLYRAARKVPWNRYLSVRDTFAVSATVKSDQFTHSHYAALRVKDAIVDQFREKTGKRPSIDTETPHLRIDVNIQGDLLRMAFDTSGESLHKRGYRPRGAKAPLNEVLAAALVAFSGWKPEEPLYLPMCGSGTLVMEAAMIAADLPPQWFRNQYGFMNQANFDKAEMMAVRQELWNNRKPVVPTIYGSDIERAAIRQSAESIARISWEHLITLKQADFFDLPKPTESGVVILNPPYGERMQTENIEALYRNIGRKLKDDFTGCRCFIISSNLEAYKHIGFKPFAKHTLYNGQLACRYAGFELYEGSRKQQQP
jgi:putative N6-adenine-specific DNA methylase